ncbi:MAG: hypothetical protein ACTSP4_05985, partial [Candidatus Hodarchaeales archaeon]
ALGSTEAEKLLNRFSEGVPLSYKDVGPDRTIEDFLISLDEADLAFTEITERISKSRSRRGYAFVLGKYGSGKSQLKNRIMSNQLETIIAVRADLSFPFISFSKTLVEATLNFLDSNPMIQRMEIDPILRKLLESDDLSEKEITMHIVETMKTTFKLGMSFSFLFDEVDKIKDIDDFRPWVDFITTIHDYFTEGYFITFFTTERDRDRLWNKDTRLERLQKWLSDPYELESSYGDKLLEGAANIIALASTSNNSHLQKQSITLIEKHLDKNKRKYSNNSIRSVNITSYNLVDMLIKMENSSIWEKVGILKTQDYGTLKQLSEYNLKQMLKEIEIPFTHVDEVYMAKFHSGAVNTGSLRTDITLGLYKTYEEQEMLITSIPVKISYDPSDEEISMVLEASKAQRSIFFVMGARVEQAFNVLENQIQDYRVFLEEINELDFLPVLGLPDGKTGASKRLFRVIKNWFMLTSSIRAKTMAWLIELADQKRQEFLSAEIEELRAMMSALKKKTAPVDRAIGRAIDELSGVVVSEEVPETKERIISEEAVMLVISAFEMVKQRKNRVKAVNSLTADLQKRIEESGGETVDFQEAKMQVETVIKKLIENNFLSATKKFYNKTSEWNKSSIIEAIL